MVDHKIFTYRSVIREKPELPTMDEVHRYIQAAKLPRDQALLAVLVEGGMRVGVLSAPYPKGSFKRGPPYLSFGDVKEIGSGRNITIRKLKKGHERDVRIIQFAAYLIRWMTLHPTQQDEDPLFCYQREGELHALSYNRVWKIVRQAAKDAGIKKRIHPNLWRKYFATTMYNAGQQEITLTRNGDGAIEATCYRRKRRVRETRVRQESENGLREDETRTTDHDDGNDVNDGGAELS